jgi:hypothetical protein
MRPEEHLRVREANTDLAIKGFGGYRLINPHDHALQVAQVRGNFSAADLIQAREQLIETGRQFQDGNDMFMAACMGTELLERIYGSAPMNDEILRFTNEVRREFFEAEKIASARLDFPTAITALMHEAFLDLRFAAYSTENDEILKAQAEFAFGKVRNALAFALSHNPKGELAGKIRGTISELIIGGGMLVSIQNELGVIGLPALPREEKSLEHTASHLAMNENYDYGIYRILPGTAKDLLQKIQVKTTYRPNDIHQGSYAVDIPVVTLSRIMHEYEQVTGIAPFESVREFARYLASSTMEGWEPVCDSIYLQISEHNSMQQSRAS